MGDRTMSRQIARAMWVVDRDLEGFRLPAFDDCRKGLFQRFPVLGDDQPGREGWLKAASCSQWKVASKGGVHLFVRHPPHKMMMSLLLLRMASIRSLV